MSEPTIPQISNSVNPQNYPHLFPHVISDKIDVNLFYNKDAKMNIIKQANRNITGRKKIVFDLSTQNFTNLDDIYLCMDCEIRYEYDIVEGAKVPDLTKDLYLSPNWHLKAFDKIGFKFGAVNQRNDIEIIDPSITNYFNKVMYTSRRDLEANCYVTSGTTCNTDSKRIFRNVDKSNGYIDSIYLPAFNNLELVSTKVDGGIGTQYYTVVIRQKLTDLIPALRDIKFPIFQTKWLLIMETISGDDGKNQWYLPGEVLIKDSNFYKENANSIPYYSINLMYIERLQKDPSNEYISEYAKTLNQKIVLNNNVPTTNIFHGKIYNNRFFREDFQTNSYVQNFNTTIVLGKNPVSYCFWVTRDVKNDENAYNILFDPTIEYSPTIKDVNNNDIYTYADSFRNPYHSWGNHAFGINMKQIEVEFGNIRFRTMLTDNTNANSLLKLYNMYLSTLEIYHGLEYLKYAISYEEYKYRPIICIPLQNQLAPNATIQCKIMIEYFDDIPGILVHKPSQEWTLHGVLTSQDIYEFSPLSQEGTIKN